MAQNTFLEQSEAPILSTGYGNTLKGVPVCLRPFYDGLGYNVSIPYPQMP